MLPDNKLKHLSSYDISHILARGPNTHNDPSTLLRKPIANNSKVSGKTHRLSKSLDNFDCRKSIKIPDFPEIKSSQKEGRSSDKAVSSHKESFHVYSVCYVPREHVAGRVENQEKEVYLSYLLV